MTELDLSFRPRKAAPPTRLAATRFALQFLRHPHIQLLLLFAAISALAGVLTFGLTLNELWGALALLAVYPFAEYALHRLVLHNPIWCRWPWTARLWSELHHWHHLHPTDTNVLLPRPLWLVAAATGLSLPIGWLAGGAEGAGAAFPLGFLLVAAYEYMHLGAHLVAEPATRWGKAMRHRHMLHHFQNGETNFGMTTPIVDWLLHTSATNAETLPRTPSTRTLGYDGAMIARYPALADLEAKRALPPNQ